MSFGVVGQRCVSEREPELGLGMVISVDSARIGIRFPATGEHRLYARGTTVLERVQFRVGETIATRDGATLVIESIEEHEGLLTYQGQGRRVLEDAISDVTSVSLPGERLMAGQVAAGEVFDLRLRALQVQTKLRQSAVRGFLGGRVELIPHQFYILHEVSSRQIPRVLLADEVGLGKTIEACLIVQRLLAVGKARRVLVLVPESLTHQWFVELLRRFNLWFSIYDEERCSACEQSDPGQNPFHAAQLVLCSVSFLAGATECPSQRSSGAPPPEGETPALSGPALRREQALSAGWDLVVVDEAHHLAWSPDAVSPEYSLVEQLAQKSPGLLLLTATPMQLGLAGHFARLRLLDPNRYENYSRFIEEIEDFGRVAAIVEKVIDKKTLNPKDEASLKSIFHRDPETLDRLLKGVTESRPGARESLIRTLLDQHGTGRVMFRTTRAVISGFPERKFCPVPIAKSPAALRARIAREFLAEETGGDAGIRYSFKEDPRIDWLLGLLQEQRPAKVLLICKSQRKVIALEAALKEKANLNIGLFHEGLPLVLRDRQAAWFAEPDGAQLMICSEIGSEGRNFQFAHHLVLFDLPLDPGLVEQRIGRLDRIGQSHAICIHFPYIVGSSDEFLIEWYHRGLDAMETPLQGGNDYQEAFRERLLALAPAHGKGSASDGRADLEAFIEETVAFRKTLSLEMTKGRDRLLELSSFNHGIAERVIEQVREADADPTLRAFMSDLLDHFGVRIREHEGGDLFLDPSHAYIEGFPSIPPDGMLVTFSRPRAIVREDIRFLSQDHPLVQDAIDLLIDSRSGTTAFSLIPSPTPNLLLETVFVLETVADSRWHTDQFLAAQPVRVLVDIRGQDLTESRDAKSISAEAEDGEIQRFLERAGFNAAVLKAMLEGATELATEKTRTIVAGAEAKASAVLGAELQRLVDLRKVNDHVRSEELELTKEQLRETRAAIAAARLRLDSIRLIVEGRNPGSAKERIDTKSLRSRAGLRLRFV